MDEKLDEPLVCKICSQLADGVHFSVMACRACAAFFRRTIILKLTYECREANKCMVDNAFRNMCRSCRLSRCLSKGMKAEYVQLKRDPIKIRKMIMKGTDNGVTIASSLKEVLRGDKNEKSTEPAGVMLKKMTNGYDHFMMIRKATSGALNIDPTEVKVSRFDNAKKVCQVEAHLVTDIVNTYFVPFGDLKFEDKVALFKNFFCYFSHTDRAYQSFKQFEKEEENDKILMPDGGFIQRNELDKFYKNAKGVHKSAEDAAKIFQPAFNYILDVIVDYMRRIQIVKTEYLALLGFCLWDDAVVGLSKEARNKAIESQNRLLDELQDYYKSQSIGADEITKRVGHLFLLVPKLTKCVLMLRENSVLAELFNYYDADVCCKNFKEDSTGDLECTSTCIVHAKTE